MLAENSKEYQLDSNDNGLDFKFKDLDVSIEFGESPDKQGVIEVSYFGKVKTHDIPAGDASLRKFLIIHDYNYDGIDDVALSFQYPHRRGNNCIIFFICDDVSKSCKVIIQGPAANYISFDKETGILDEFWLYYGDNCHASCHTYYSLYW